MFSETGIFLNFFEKGGLMMDVGSGTYGQMYRKYGPATTKVYIFTFVAPSNANVDFV